MAEDRDGGGAGVVGGVDGEAAGFGGPIIQMDGAAELGGDFEDRFTAIGCGGCAAGGQGIFDKHGAAVDREAEVGTEETGIGVCGAVLVGGFRGLLMSSCLA